MAIFYFVQQAPKLHCNDDVIHPFYWKSAPRTRWWCLKCVIVYLARDIPLFVMYCVNGKPRSSLLIESTDSMIYQLYDKVRGSYYILVFCDLLEEVKIKVCVREYV